MPIPILSWEISAWSGADASPIQVMVEIGPEPRYIGYAAFSTPFGPAAAFLDADGVCGLGFGSAASVLADFQSRWPRASFVQDLPAADTVRQVLEGGGALNLCLSGTAWQILVWRELLNLPRGRTIGYGDLARALGRPQAARAVGAAVGANPIAYVIPCHRVVAKEGDGTAYHWGAACKAALLASEGIYAPRPSTSAIP